MRMRKYKKEQIAFALSQKELESDVIRCLFIC